MGGGWRKKESERMKKRRRCDGGWVGVGVEGGGVAEGGVR